MFFGEVFDKKGEVAGRKVQIRLRHLGWFAM
jgi:hypothetical protein